jgi:pimeloyl-ACP methyl ester carboxylesterase
MQIIERGRGTPLVIIPGIQGRWEYMRPAVEALAEHFRVLTFSLCGEPHSGRRFDRRKGLDNFVDQIETILDTNALSAALICGVSFGGLAALRFAARHAGRTLGLVLVSTPEPGWHLRPRHDAYTRLPWIFGPVFLAEAPWRLRDELRAAFPDPADRRRFARRQLRTLVTAPLSPSRMAARARLIQHADAARACAGVEAPTLIVTGEPGLDHVLASREHSAYASLIKNARTAILPQTGHIGLVTRPQTFAARLSAFADEVLRRREAGAVAIAKGGASADDAA